MQEGVNPYFLDNLRGSNIQNHEPEHEIKRLTETKIVSEGGTEQIATLSAEILEFLLQSRGKGLMHIGISTNRIRRGEGAKTDVARGGDDVVVVGGCAGGVAAEEDGSAVELEGVMQGIEDIRWDEASRKEDVCPSKGRPSPGRRHLYYRLSLLCPLFMLVRYAKVHLSGKAIGSVILTR